MENFLDYLDQFRYMAGSLAMCILLCRHALPKREAFRTRLSISSLICFLLAFAYVPLSRWLRPVMEKAPIAIAPYWLMMSFALVGFVYVCYETTIAGALFRTMMAVLTENIAACLVRNLLVYTLFPDLPARNPLLYIVCMTAFYCLFYWAASRVLGTRIRSDEIARLTNERSAAGNFLFLYLAYTAMNATCKYVMEMLIVPLSRHADLLATYRYLQLYLVGSMLLLDVVMTVVLWSIYRRTALQAEKEIIVRLARERKNQYEFSRENIDMINRKTHDLKHQLQALAMATDDERRQQIEETSRAIGFYDAVVKTGNEALDVLLTEKSVYCANRNIRLSCMVHTKQLSRIRVVDLYTMLGNALDNAIESTERLSDPERKVISLSILDQGNMLYIELENYFDGVLDIRDGLPQTQKMNKLDHGYGIKSIRSIVQSYGGRLDIHTEGQIFYLEIIIP